MGDCLLWAVILKTREIDHCFGLRFHGYGYELNLTKMPWATFWAIFYKLIWTAWCVKPIEKSSSDS
jgi:hypothetical protein